MLIIYLIGLLFVTNVHLNLIYKRIYYTLPPKSVDYCLHHYGVAFDHGCESHPKGNAGTLVYLENGTSVNDFLHIRLLKERTTYIAVISYDVYRNKYLVRKLLNKKKFVKGLALLEPTKEELKKFKCESFASCGYSNKYVYFRWPIPIILIRYGLKAQENVMKCAALSKIKNTCAMEIYYPQFYSTGDVSECSKELYNNYETRKKRKTRCNFLTGHNYYYALYNPEVKNEMFIILYVYMDVNSIFEGSGYGSNRVIPVVTVLMNVIKVFQKYLKLLKYDILVAFIDNYNVNNAGLKILYNDLNNNRVKIRNRIYKIENIVFSINLDSFSKLNNADFYITQNIVEKNKLRPLNVHLKQSATMFDIILYQLPIDDSIEDIRKITQLRVKVIRDASNLKNVYEETFNDRYPFKSRKIDIIKLSLLIISTFKKLLLNNSNSEDVYTKKLYVCLTKKTACPKPKSSYSITEDDIKFGIQIFDCLTRNHTCSILKPITSQLEKYFFDTFGNPFVCQEQRTKYVKDIPMTSRLSTIMKRILIYKFGIPAKMDFCEKKTPSYFILRVNNKLKCHFVNMVINEGPINFTFVDNDGTMKHMYSYRTNLKDKPSVRLFKIPDARSEAFLLVTGTMLFTITFLLVICLREYYPESRFDPAKKLILRYNYRHHISY